MSTTGIEASPRYATSPARPVSQVAMRIALWAAVLLGAVGGITGFFRSPGSDSAEAVDEQATAPTDQVPAPVTSVAERAVDAWLTATSDDADKLAALFVEPPTVEGSLDERFTVVGVTAIAGVWVRDGSWSVTVAADIEEVVPADESTSTGELSGEPSAEEAPVTASSTWYVEVGIVGEVDGRLAAIATPAVVPAPPPLAREWRSAGPAAGTTEADDYVMTTVQNFLDALLAGGGDPARYLAPGVTMAAADPAPFEDIEVQSLGTEEVQDGQLWVRADAVGTSPNGHRQALAYDLILYPNDGKWDVLRVSAVFAQ